MSEHTPGPWRFSESWHPAGGRFSGSDADANGNVFWGYHITGSDENGAHILPTLAAVHNFPQALLANARLIAAAPELLEACKLFVQYDSNEDDDVIVLMNNYALTLEATKAAIAKAIGTP